MCTSLKTIFPRLVNLKSLVFTTHDATKNGRQHNIGSKVPLVELLNALPSPKLLERLILVGRSFHIGGVSPYRGPTFFFPFAFLGVQYEVNLIECDITI